MTFGETIEHVGQAVDAAGVGAIVVGIAWASIVAVRDVRRDRDGRSDDPHGDVFQRYRRRLGRAILLGLEILVAADIIRTVAIAPTFESVGVLALIVLIRTFLSASLTVEIEGRWPWQRSPEMEERLR